MKNKPLKGDSLNLNLHILTLAIDYPKFVSYFDRFTFDTSQNHFQIERERPTIRTYCLWAIF